MAKLTAFALVFFVACLFVLSSRATPITDVSSTSIAITETEVSPSLERFMVAVKRVDDLVDDNGEVLAERVMAVIINFDLKDDQLLVNNVPVQLGVESVQVIEAEIIRDNIGAEEYKDLSKNFSVGLVTVEVASYAESLPLKDNGVSLRRITINARIVEIDGQNVVQTEAIEKIYEAKVIEVADGDDDDSTLVSYVPSDDQVKPAFRPCRNRSLAGRIRHWWRCSSRFVRIVVASGILTALFGIVFIAVPAGVQALIAAYQKRSSNYQAISLDNEEDDLKVEQVIYITDEEKLAFLEEEKEQQQ